MGGKEREASEKGEEERRKRKEEKGERVNGVPIEAL